MRIRTIAAALVIGITSLSVVSTASAKEHTKSTKFDKPAKCVKLSKKGNKMKCKTKTLTVVGKQGANGKDGTNGINGVNGVGTQGPAGKDGATGPQGLSGLEGAFYAQGVYNAGDTNAGAIASVGCDADKTKTNYTAIAGGVQVLGLDAGANSRNTPVSSSFPGRMDWSKNAPFAGRLDGWIVQFGGNAGATSDKAPEKVIVWALCVPRTDIPVKMTFQQS